MKLTHERAPITPSTPRRRLVTTSRGRRDDGYILVQFALLLVPLLLMAGLSIDVGYWYNKASDIQKAADAAALAGVVWLPNNGEAIANAKVAARRNGYDDADPEIHVDVRRVPGTTRQLRVTITDDSVDSFFYQSLGGAAIELGRSATAEYLLPVPLGSPENSFGNDMTKPPAERSGLWGNIHGPLTNNTKGDAYAAACRTVVPGSPPKYPDGCSTFLTEYRPSGYLFTVDVGKNVSGLDINVYDAGLYPRIGANGKPNESLETGDATYSDDADVTTTWKFYWKDGSPLVVDDNPVATASQCGPPSTPWDSPDPQDVPGSAVWRINEGARAAAFKNNYATICHISNPPEGRYLLRVQTSGGSGANRYAIKAEASSTNQPRVSAYGDFSMYNNINAGNANFYLAEVVPEHAGKTLIIDMYDPGEINNGNATMKVLEPDGSVAGSCVGQSDSPDSTFSDGATLSPCQFLSSVDGKAKYNGSWVQLQIKIPNDYTCQEGLPTSTDGKCWWKIRYEIGGQANDTTTWAAQVVGDPVHLVEEG